LLVASFPTIDEAEPAWERVLGVSDAATLFLTPWWQKTWWRHFGGDAEHAVYVASDGERPIGVAPLVRSDGVLELLGATDLFDYRDFIVERGREEDFCAALLGHLSELEWHTLRLESVRESSATLRALGGAAKSAGMSVEIELEDVAPVAALPATWEEFVSGLSKKDRHELRRKIRRLHGAGEVTRSVCSSPEQVPGMMAGFLRLHRASSPDKAEFMTAEREAFFLDVVAEAARRGRLRLEEIALDGQIVASCLGFDYPGTFLLYNSGYDPENSKLSVGIVSKALAIKGAIESGDSVFDFLRGSEDYKYRLGGQDRQVHRVTVRR
jgi:CelD/BcsL family acetyltransferase involved in cellulose biosynthesis